MKYLCLETQEQIALGENLSQILSQHLNQCRSCQSVFADYQSLVFAFENQKEFMIPDAFAELVMAKVSELENKKDWFENILLQFEKWSSKKVFEYSYLTAGAGLGLISFIRFVVFIFIPAG